MRQGHLPPWRYPCTYGVSGTHHLPEKERSEPKSFGNQNSTTLKAAKAVHLGERGPLLGPACWCCRALPVHLADKKPYDVTQLPRFLVREVAASARGWGAEGTRLARLFVKADQ
ncbi:hypothetical protein MC885_013820 [Smutsia gigantea]|nr:hypothetical protein MC885_013820 [Smutsia gigantea]